MTVGVFFFFSSVSCYFCSICIHAASATYF